MKKQIIFAWLIAAIILLAGNITYGQDFADNIGTANKTMTNVQADTVNVTITKSRTAITFKYDIAKTSGTVAGTIVLQGRITPVSNTLEQWSTINSYTLTDATANNVVALTANNYVYYRVITTTSGTSVSVHNKQLLYRQFYPLQ